LRAIEPNSIKRLRRQVIRAFEAPRPPRAANPYATHLPILIGLGRLMKIRQVLELGSGLHSSPCFLDRRVFPDLLQWHAIENDFHWGEQVANLIGSDGRAKITFVDQPIQSAVREMDFSAYDLIFIDDSGDSDQRAATIREIAGRCPQSTVVVIHDWEIPAYRQAARSLPQRFSFEAFNPSTGVAWLPPALDPRQLKSLSRHIQRHADGLAPERLTEWIDVISHWPNGQSANHRSASEGN